MPDVQRITIVGGGVIGCFLADRLALEGVPVTVIERDYVGSGATGASAGNIQPGVMGGVVDAQCQVCIAGGATHSAALESDRDVRLCEQDKSRRKSPLPQKRPQRA